MDELRASHSEYLGQLEVVNVADITEGQFPEVFVGVDAVIHTATPMPARNSAEEVLKVRCLGKLPSNLDAHSYL